MKFLKSLLVSVALIAAATSANATAYNWGVLSEGDSYKEYSVAAGSFLDTITFTLDQDYTADFGAGVLNVIVGKKQFQYISDLNVTLVDVEDVVLGSGLNFTLDSLVAGTYTLKISGVASGINQEAGKYGVGVTIAAVPEPSSVAMLLVGFAALGVAARRRKSL